MACYPHPSCLVGGFISTRNFNPKVHFVVKRNISGFTFVVMLRMTKTNPKVAERRRAYTWGSRRHEGTRHAERALPKSGECDDNGRMSEEQIRPISVGDLTDHIKMVVEGTFPPVWVSGEISGLTKARSGHIYFTLKDDRAQLRCVIWRTAAQFMRFDLKDGQAVFCHGELEVYAARGSYQLVVRKAEAQGVGALQQAFLRLQAKLDAEGLFAAERKRAIPKVPRRIAIITSPSGAAVRDFLQAASERWNGAEIIVVPALVQGEGSATSLVRAIRTSNRMKPKPDVIVLSRGGGSLEDLWSFNEEPLVRAVAESRIPTVSAVGHEVDVTLCDLAADVRALTPTDAATKVIPDSEMIAGAMASLQNHLQRTMRNMIESRKQRLEALSMRPILRKPHEILHLRSRRLDELDARANRAMNARIQLSKGKVATLAASLSALSPLDVLTRGYSVTLDKNANAIDSSDQVNVGDTLTTKLHQGEIESTVIRIR